MSDGLKAACVQLNAGPDIDENLEVAQGLIRRAAGQGAQFIATPENTDCIRRYAKDKIAGSDAQDQYKPVQYFAALAKELNIWLLIGSLAIKIDEERCANRSFLFAPDGSINATYDKIHMFDVNLSRTEFYNESKDYEAGKNAVIAGNDDFKLGLGICYDLRFPHLWRDMAKQGAQILSAPAAFTVPTGKAHWEVLLRARAIETGCFVIAPAQTGEHEGGRKTYGHSMIISPWGEILAAMEEGIGMISADLNMDDVEKARAKIPALTHDRKYSVQT